MTSAGNKRERGAVGRQVWRWAGYGAALVLLAVLVATANWSEMWDILEHTNKSLLVAMLLLCHAQFVLAAVIWKRFLLKGGVDIGLSRLSLYYLIGNFFSTLLPSRYSGDVYRAYAVGRDSGKMYTAAASVLLERLSGIFVLLFMGLVASLFARELLSNSLMVYTIIIVFGMFFAGAALLFTGRLYFMVDRLFRSLGFLGFLVKPMRKFHDAVMVCREQRGFLFRINLLAFLFKVFAFVCIDIAAMTLHLDVPFLALMLIMPLIYVLEAIPVSIYGMGIREGAFVLFFTQIGLTFEQAFALSIVVLFGRLACSLTGGLLYFGTRHRKFPPPPPPAEEADLGDIKLAPQPV